MYVSTHVYGCVCVYVEESESESNRDRMWMSEWVSEKRNEMKRNETSVGIIRDIAII